VRRLKSEPCGRLSSLRIRSRKLVDEDSSANCRHSESSDADSRERDSRLDFVFRAFARRLREIVATDGAEALAERLRLVKELLARLPSYSTGEPFGPEEFDRGPLPQPH